MHSEAKLPVLVVGQTPPPITGQAVMIENLVRGQYDLIRIHHVRMNFSREISEIGRFQFRKPLHLVALVTRILWARFRHGCQTLCYPPAGQTPNAVYRDIAILLCVRPLFRTTIFYFHAGGVSELVADFPPLLRWLAHRAYGRPAATIRPSDLNPDDGAAFQSAADHVIANALEDVAADFKPRTTATSPQPHLLFMGILYESKGVMVLLEACAALTRQGRAFDLVLAGAWGSDAFKTAALAFVAEHDLSDRVHFAGVLTGAAKWQAFHDADIFCFPSYFESETFGLVLLEAMQFGLPVVATQWRGIPSLVKHGETGLLVPTRDPGAVAEAIEGFLADPEQARRMGRNGRAAFCAHFSLSRYCRDVEQVFLTAQDAATHQTVDIPPLHQAPLGDLICSTHTVPQLIDEVRTLLTDPQQHPRRILCLNAHIYNLAQHDEALRARLNAARIVAADGMSVVWALRTLGTPIAQRCNMTEAFRAFLTTPDLPPTRTVLIGCRDIEATRAAARISALSPRCQITDSYSGYLPPTAYRDSMALQDPPDMILVGASTPRSEELIEQASAWYPNAVVWHIGAGTIRILAGEIQEAPAWLRRLGLQWLHRLAVEPATMWRRYLLGNPAFIRSILHHRRRMRGQSAASMPTALLAWGGCAALFALLFARFGNTHEPAQFGRSILGWLWSQWNDPGSESGHGFFIPFVSAYFIWNQRGALRQAIRTGQPDWRAMGVAVGALLLYWAGVRSQQPRLGVMSMILLLWSIPWWLYGITLARRLLVPCAYLAFAIPMSFLAGLTFPLRLLATHVAVVILQGLRVGVVRRGTAILSSEPGRFALDVADACSGLRSLIAMTALMAAFAYVAHRANWRRWTLFLCAVPIAITANICRVISLVLVADRMGTEQALKVSHDYSGYLVFTVVVLLMVTVSHHLGRWGKHEPAS